MTENNLITILNEGAKSINIDISDSENEAFARYAELLREWNEVMNLTNILDDEGIAIRHFVDSLTVVPYVMDEQAKQKRNELTLVDVGTGAGFPGIPLKVKMPELKITLMDSLRKRLNFLDAVCTDINLKGIRTAHARAEDAGHDANHREKYDIATARAVAALPVLCEYCLPFVKVGGCFIAMKGHADEELSDAGKAIKLLGGKIERTEKFTLPGSDMSRTIVVIRKIAHTPKNYPRQAGKPSKNPIA